MNKKSLVKLLAERTGENPTKMDELTTEIFSTIQAILEGGEEIQIQGFGKLYPRKSKPTRRRNPINREMIELPSKTNVFFKASPVLKKRLNKEF